jgi:hypothetical protein
MFRKFNSPFNWWLTAVTTVFVTLIWLIFLYIKYRDRNDTLASAVNRNNNLVIALEQYVIRTIQNADAILILVKNEYQQKGDKADLEKLLYDNPRLKDFIRGVAIIDTNGTIKKLHIQNNTQPNINLFDSDFFQFHKHHSKDELYISKPITSRTIGKPVIFISRRINQNGFFAGVVAVQIEPSAFTSFYAQYNLRPHEIISLIAPDGTTYARRIGNVESS